MSDTQLKPCPFCGHPAEHYNVNGNKLVKCTNQYCINTICTWPERVWNTRPIEDALQARITELEAENAKLRASAIAWQPFIEGSSEPKESGYYLTLQKVGKFLTIILTEYWVAVPGYWDTKSVVTHWAYLPEPPEDK